MQITITRNLFLRGLGWVMAALFWITLFTVITLIWTAPGDSGAGYVAMGVFMVIGITFPMLLVPVGIIIYGVRREHAQPLFKVLAKWGSIASAVYFICLLIAIYLMY